MLPRLALPAQLANTCLGQLAQLAMPTASPASRQLLLALLAREQTTFRPRTQLAQPVVADTTYLDRPAIPAMPTAQLARDRLPPVCHAQAASIFLEVLAATAMRTVSLASPQPLLVPRALEHFTFHRRMPPVQPVVTGSTFQARPATLAMPTV